MSDNPDPSLTPYLLGLYNSGTYIPAIQNIQAITQSTFAQITTESDNSYVVNQQVQFFIPRQWGMRQLDKLKGFVLSILSSKIFTISIDTSQFDAFIVPSLPSYIVIDPAQVSAIGDQNSGKLAPGGRLALPLTPPGAFENQPP